MILALTVRILSQVFDSTTLRKKSRSREILIQKAPLPLVHSHSVSLVFSIRWKESRLNGVETGHRTQSGYELTVRELFELMFRVITIFLSVVDSNTCDKIRTIRARITCNNARNIDLRYLKGY